MKKMLRVPLAVLTAAVVVYSLCLPCYAAKGSYSWVGAWSTSPVEAVVETNGVKMSDFLMNQTVRIFLNPTLDGNKVRFKLSNQFGNSDVKIDGINVARASVSGENSIRTDTLVPLTVKGESSFTIPKGTYVYTDAVAMKISALETVAVTYYVSGLYQMRTAGLVGAKTYTSAGNHLTDEAVSNEVLLESDISGLTYNTIPYLVNMDVWAENASSVVIIGDSTVANNIPALLAQKLVGSGVKNIGVLQQAICGNRLLYDGVGFLGNIYGPSLLSRFDSDALKQAGVNRVFVKIGGNDILHPRTVSMKDKAPEASVDEIISGYEQLIARAHALGMKIYFFEITPWKGYSRELLTSGVDLVWSQEAQDMCDLVNKWIRKNNSADGYINLDALRDDSDKDKLEDIFTKDGIHFDNLAQVEVVDAIPAEYLGFKKSQLTPLKTILENKIEDTSWSSEGGNDTEVPTKNPDSTGTQPATSANSAAASDSSTVAATNGVTDYSNNAMSTASSGELTAYGGTLSQSLPADGNTAVAAGTETQQKNGISVIKLILIIMLVFTALIAILAVAAVIVIRQKSKKQSIGLEKETKIAYKSYNDKQN